MVTRKQALVGEQVLPPYASNDADVVLDVELTSLAAAQAAGFTLLGTTGTFDENGFKPGSNGCLVISGLDSNDLRTGTLYAEIERAGISWDTASQGTTSLDSIGRPIDSQQHAALHMTGSGASTKSNEQISFRFNNTAAQNNWFAQRVSGTWNEPIANCIIQDNQITDALLDEPMGRYAKCIRTWEHDTLETCMHVDGMAVQPGTYLNAAPNIEANGNLVIGANWNQAGSLPDDIANMQWFFGDYYIKRVQLSKKKVLPRKMYSSIKIACGIDSFYQNMTGAPAAGDADLAAVVHSKRIVERGLDNIRSHELAGGDRYRPLRFLKAHSINAGGPLFTAFNIGQSNKGWTGVGTPIPDEFLLAAAKFGMSLFVTGGTVNDVQNSATPTPYATGQGLIDLKAKLDVLIDAAPRLHKIFFFETWWCSKDGGNRDTAAWRAELARMDAELAGIDGYRGIVEYVATSHLWGGQAGYSEYYTRGSNPLLTAAGLGTDVHMTTSGHVRAEEIMRPILTPYLFGDAV